MNTLDVNPSAEGTELHNESTASLAIALRELDALNPWVTPRANVLKLEEARCIDWHKLEAWLEGDTITKAFSDKEKALLVSKYFQLRYLGSLVKKSVLNSVRVTVDTEETVTNEVKNTQSQNEDLQSQVKILTSQVEMLKSLAGQERRTAAKATQQYDQLQAHHDAFQTEVLDRLAQGDAARTRLQAALVGKADGRLCMAESYQGEVMHVSGDSVVVVFEIEGDLVEQTYNRKQFLDSRLPEKGDRLAAYVHIVILPAKEEKNVDEITSSHDVDKPRKPRKNVVPIPRTF